MRAQMQEKRSQLLTTFVLLSAGISFIAILGTAPITGLIFYLPFSALSLTWLTSDLRLDPIAKICIGVFTVGLGFYLSSLPLVSQTIIGALTTGGISFYFFKAVWRSQDSLNTELQNAASNSDLAQVQALRARGADPYAPNLTDYNAFHLAIRNHEQAPQVIAALRQGESTPAPTLISLLPGLDTLRGHEGVQRQQFSQTWNNLIESIKTLFKNDGFSENFKVFYQSIGAVFELYAPFFSNTLDSLAFFLRHQMAYPSNLQAKNNANRTAFDMIQDVALGNHKLREELKAALTRPAEPLPDQPHNQDPEFNYQAVVTGARMFLSTVAAAATQRPATSATQEERRVNSAGPQ